MKHVPVSNVLKEENNALCDEEICLEEVRRNMSAILIHTDEKHPIKCVIQIGESEAVGLSSLLLPVVIEVFMQPTEGIIWFKIEGMDELMEFDDMAIEDLLHIYHELQ